MTEQGLAFGRSSDPHAHPTSGLLSDTAQRLEAQASAAQSSQALGSGGPALNLQSSAGQDSAGQVSLPSQQAAHDSVVHVSSAQASTAQSESRRLDARQRPEIGLLQQPSQQISNHVPSVTAAEQSETAAHAAPASQHHQGASHTQDIQTRQQGLDQNSPGMTSLQTNPSYSPSQGGILLTGVPPQLQSGALQPNQASSAPIQAALKPITAASDTRTDSPVRARVRALEQRVSSQGMLQPQEGLPSDQVGLAATPLHGGRDGQAGSYTNQQLPAQAGANFAGAVCRTASALLSGLISIPPQRG